MAESGETPRAARGVRVAAGARVCAELRAVPGRQKGCSLAVARVKLIVR